MADVSVLVSDLLDTFDRGEGSGRLDQRHDGLMVAVTLTCDPRLLVYLSQMA